MRARQAFTLLELLVVIASIALLIALLMPVLQQAKRQAQAVACQSKLRQWGQICATYTTDNDGQFFGWGEFFGPFFSSFYRDRNGNYYFGSYRRDRGEMLLCPSAPKARDGQVPEVPACFNLGDRSSAWAWFLTYPQKPWFVGSYGLNFWVLTYPPPESGDPSPSFSSPPLWRTCLVRGASKIPVLVDCRIPHAAPRHNNDPPDYEDKSFARSGAMWTFCINRHDEGINCLFMDWSVRKVGLKELWTLKWHRQYDTAGPWTKAGGAHPEDWPAWMRRFKDY